MRKILSGMQYINLVGRLATRVFGTPHLPDAEGRLLLPAHLYKRSRDGEGDYALKLHHCLISNEQRKKLNLQESYPSEVAHTTAISTEARGRGSPEEGTLHRTEQESEHWNVSDELNALGAPIDTMIGDHGLIDSRGVFPAVALYEEASNSCAMDMELRVSPDSDDDNEYEEGGDLSTSGPKAVHKLLSLDSALKMQQEMGMFSSSNEIPVASAAPDKGPTPSERMSDQAEVSDIVKESQFFLTQHPTFDSGSMDNIEDQVIREGEEMQRSLVSSASQRSSPHDVISSSKSNYTGQQEMSPMAESQLSFLELLASQNEANKSARPFIHHPKSVEIIDDDVDKEKKSEIEETEMATQPQTEYVETPSPSSAKKRPRRNGSRRHEAPSAGVTFSNSPATSQQRGKSSVVEKQQDDHIEHIADSGIDDTLLYEVTQGDVSFSLSQDSPENGSGYGNTGSLSKSDTSGGSGGGEYIGRRISKKFRNLGRFAGTVVSYDK